MKRHGWSAAMLMVVLISTPAFAVADDEAVAAQVRARALARCPQLGQLPDNVSFSVRSVQLIPKSGELLNQTDLVLWALQVLVDSEDDRYAKVEVVVDHLRRVYHAQGIDAVITVSVELRPPTSRFLQRANARAVRDANGQYVTPPSTNADSPRALLRFAVYCSKSVT